MAKKIGVVQHKSLFAQKGTKLFRALFFGFGRSSVGKRGKELLEFATELRAVPFADVAALQSEAPFSRPDRSRAIAHCHQIRSRLLSPVFCEANQWSHSSRSDTATCKTMISRESDRSISTPSRNCL